MASRTELRPLEGTGVVGTPWEEVMGGEGESDDPKGEPTPVIARPPTRCRRFVCDSRAIAAIFQGFLPVYIGNCWIAGGLEPSYNRFSLAFSGSGREKVMDLR